MKKKSSRTPALRKQSDREVGGLRKSKAASKDSETWIPGIKDSELKKRLATKAKISPDAFLTTKKGKGDSGTVFMRPPDDFNAHVRPTGGVKFSVASDDPCSGINFVETPDIGIQLNLGALNKNCPSDADLRSIERALLRQISRFRLPDPEVRAKCLNRVISIGIWPTRTGAGTCADAAREAALRNFSLLQGQVFGFFLNASLITRLAAHAFDAAPKHLSSKGFADPNGPIHLTRLLVVFRPDNKIDTIINGYDDRPWPDVGFSLTISDTIANDASCITTVTKDLSDRDLIFGGLSILFLGGLSFFVPLVIPATFFAIFTGLDAVLNLPDGPEEGGVGCKILQTVPQEVPLPAGKKLVANYLRTKVTQGGLFLSGIVVEEDRQPEVQIVGPSKLVVFEDALETAAIYRVRGNDIFGSLTAGWNSVGSAIDNPNATVTKIHFRRGNRRAGTTFVRTINITVADEDGAQMNASRTVTITVVEPDDISPVCRNKPWLDICQR